jgi:transcriptional regulator with XRE-family HTH domain
MSEGVALAFGAALKIAHTAARLSQEKLAELADLDRTTPSLYERGLRQPTVGTVIAIAEALKVDPVVLVQMTLDRLRRKELCPPQ